MSRSYFHNLVGKIAGSHDNFIWAELLRTENFSNIELLLLIL